MTGRISEKSLSVYSGYWEKFPNIKSKIFDLDNNNYNTFKSAEIKDVIFSDDDVKKYISDIGIISGKFREFLTSTLIQNITDGEVHDKISERLFQLYGNVKLLDSYSVFQAFSDEWDTIDNDLIRIQNEGKQICREIEANIVLQKDSNTKKYVEVQKGIKGKIIPISMVQEQYFKSDLDQIDNLDNERTLLENEIDDLWNELEDDTKSALSKEDGDNNCKIDNKKIDDEVKHILSELSLPETDILEQYLQLKKKQDKIEFFNVHTEIGWEQMQQSKDMTYKAAAVRAYINFMKLNHEFDTDTEEGKIVTIKKKNARKSLINKEIRTLSGELENKAIEKMTNLTDMEVDNILIKKWIDPVMNHIDEDVNQIVMKLVNALEELRDKYAHPITEIDEQIDALNLALSVMLDELCGNSVDMEAIDIFRKGISNGKKECSGDKV